MSSAAPRPLKLTFAVSATLLVVLILAVLEFAYPSSEAVRLRNSLLLAAQQPDDFDWTPAKTPATFRVERQPMPASIRAGAAAATAAAGASDLERAKALAGHLLSHATRGGRIDSFEVEETYRTIIEKGTGYCADLIDAYVALAHAAGLSVRPWAFSFDGLGGRGHIVIEIFDRQRDRWLMLDVFNNAMPIDRATGEPLGAMAFRSKFLVDHDGVRLVPIGPWRQEFPQYEKLIEYYQDGINQWYLWDGNDVVSRSDHWLIRSAGRVTEELAEVAALVLGRSPHIVPVHSQENAVAIERLKQIRTWLLVALGAGMLLAPIAFLSGAALLVIRLRAWRSGRPLRAGTEPDLRS